MPCCILMFHGLNIDTECSPFFHFSFSFKGSKPKIVCGTTYQNCYHMLASDLNILQRNLKQLISIEMLFSPDYNSFDFLPEALNVVILKFWSR